MSKFLVTGGAGFIGSHIVEHLLKRSHFVRILDNFSSGKEENLTAATKDVSNDQFELIRGDIRETQICHQACKGIDYVLHQAALRSVPRSFVEPESFNDVNLNGIMRLLQASVKHKVKRFVFASSSSIYGDTEQFPNREDQPSRVISPYALTKLGSEYYCRVFTHNFGLETVALRYFNVFGPRQDLDDVYAVVVPKFIQSLLDGESPPIYGTGEQSRDFTYVENVVSANILAAITPGIKHEIFNVACGENHTVLKLLQVLNQIFGKNIKPKFLLPRQGDIFKTHADISKIRCQLKYSPLVNFEEGLKRTAGYSKNLRARC